ncbi:putative ribosomal protein L18 [Senna tora]|uniref:Putative ribosomal protein L18 n=1 Tax=Senna tora TaxID=362788 RepID=A0A834SM08_9FABA|nr:putative ribosomal protein L18 [Senna tora]
MGWNYSKAPDNSKAYQFLSADEATANQDDLILWPPLVIIHNTITGKGRDGRMEGFGNKTMDNRVRGTENHGRKAWARMQPLTLGKDDENNPNLVKVDEKKGEKKRILYGYLGTAFDLDKVDFDTRKKSHLLGRGFDEKPALSMYKGSNLPKVIQNFSWREDDDTAIWGDLTFDGDDVAKRALEPNLSARKSPKKRESAKENAKEEKKATPSPKTSKVHQITSTKSVNLPQFGDTSATSIVNKKQRTLTFNQLTGPFHEPFCLDIYISKASVRACIVHRVTSKVVAVAHSISKDMKFDFTSTRNKNTCAAVGAILAQRALADDIHDVIYTPRKGERLEGKLQIVLQSIIDNGINVKVKIKQRMPKKVVQSPKNYGYSPRTFNNAI